jgi:hypothetical protein
MNPLKPFHRIGIIRRRHRPAYHLCQINDDEICAALMLTARDDIQHALHMHAQACFFQAFTFRCLGRVFAPVHESRRQGPHAAERLVGASYKQDAAILFDQDSRCYFRVLKMDVPALRTNGTHPAKPFLMRNLCPATRTELYRMIMRHWSSPLARCGFLHEPHQQAAQCDYDQQSDLPGDWNKRLTPDLRLVL